MLISRWTISMVFSWCRFVYRWFQFQQFIAEQIIAKQAHKPNPMNISLLPKMLIDGDRHFFLLDDVRFEHLKEDNQTEADVFIPSNTSVFPFFRQWFVGTEKLFQNNNSSKAFAAWRTRVPFIYFNKNDMECKKVLLFSLWVCVARIVFDPNGSHLFISCSIRILSLGIHRIQEEKAERKKKKCVRKERSVSVLFVFFYSRL